MVRLLSFASVTFILSCTIIEDSDITSLKEFNNLKLKSVEIKQQASSVSTAVAKVSSEVAVNIPVAGGTLKRTLWMDWPALGNSKLKLKSGYPSAFKSYTSFLESGKPWTFYLFHVNGSDTTIVELYRFRYDASGRLNLIITNAPFVDGAPATSRDTLIYGNPNNPVELTSIIRNPKSSSPSTFTLASTGGSIFSSGWSFDFQSMRYSKACQGGVCGPFWGGNYDVVNGSTGFPIGVMNLTTFQKEHLTIEDRNNSLEQWGCGSCIRYVDTFYFHPLMIIKDQLVIECDFCGQGNQFKLGDALLFLYMVDWWKPVTTQESDKDEKVTFSFNYGQ